MQLGMIGLGRMGTGLVRRLLRAGHECAVHDRDRDAVMTLAREGAAAPGSLAGLASRLAPPRALWLMVPAEAVDVVLAELTPHLEKGDMVIDGGNSDYREDLRRAKELGAQGLHYLDVGTSGGVWGLERGFCLMIGGPADAVAHLDPVFAALAPGAEAAPATPGRPRGRGTADRGYLHCGASGAGHFVKMVHNGIEYGLMAAYAEGLNILRHANVGAGRRAPEGGDAETTPLPHPEHYRYDIDLAEVAEVWRRGSVIASWLLDLTAAALAADPELKGFQGRVSDSGEGRWTLEAAVDEGVPAPILATALFGRFASRGEASFSGRVLSAMRHRFGGHDEKAAPGSPASTGMGGQR